MKILYRISQLPHQRVFEKLKPIPGVEQVIVGPQEKKSSISNYGYKDFDIKNIIYYSGKQHLSNIIEQEEPDLYVDSVFSFFNKKFIYQKIPQKCKIGYIHHGFCAKTSVDVFRMHDRVYNRDWMKKAAEQLSFACGGIKYFYDWMAELGANANNISLNSLPQVDLLFDKKYYVSRKKAIFNEIGSDVKKSILYFGRIGKGEEYNKTNIEFFNTLFEIFNIAKKNDMVIFVKPKLRSDKILDFLKNNMKSFYKNYKHRLEEIMESNIVHFIDVEGHIYQFFFADIVILNGSSSVEVESILASKPTITVNSVNNIYVDDIYDCKKFGAVLHVTDIKNLNKAIDDSFNDSVINRLLSNRDNYIFKNNILFDGKAHERAQQRIIKTLEKR